MRYLKSTLIVVLLLGLVAGCNDGGIGPVLSGATSAQLRQRVREVLFEASKNADPVIRCHALESFAVMGKPYAGEFIRSGLDDEIVVVRFAAAVAAGDVRSESARSRLEKLLRDPGPSVRLAAGYALERMGDNRFGQWYNRALMGDDPQLAAQACMLLGKLGNTPQRADSRDKLWQVLQKKDQAITVKLQAAEALAKLGDGKIIKKLLVYASSGYADDRMIAISALEQIGGTDAYAMLTTLVDDPQVEVQLAAMKALGKLAEPGDVEFCREQLHYTHPEGDDMATNRVRGLAALALGRIGTQQDGSLLYQVMNEDHPYVRLAAARAALDYLGRYGSRLTQ